MLLRHAPWHWGGLSEPRGNAAAIDVGLRDYTRSFAVPLVLLAFVIAALLVALWFAEIT